MGSQELLWFTAALGLGFTILFLFGRKGFMQPSRLKLRRMNSSRAPVVPANSHERVFSRSYQDILQVDSTAKNLNVIFMFNGHSWDAHEVLGSPAGGNAKLVKEAYQKALASCDPASREFIEMAYLAILHDQKAA